VISSIPLIPAKAGTQITREQYPLNAWAPAFAGVSGRGKAVEEGRA
jgi:hypothetical protein